MAERTAVTKTIAVRYTRADKGRRCSTTPASMPHRRRRAWCSWRAWPRRVGEARVTVRLSDAEPGARIEMSEVAQSGPSGLLPEPVQLAGVEPRNRECLLRLARIAEHETPITFASRRSAATVDAAVIGAGHNGLVAAALLADAGWDVLVLEAQSDPGGAVRSADCSRATSATLQRFYPLRRPPR